ncbi:MAG: hypothetical protein WC284_11760 [Candidimonas sp.]
MRSKEITHIEQKWLWATTMIVEFNRKLLPIIEHNPSIRPTDIKNPTATLCRFEWSDSWDIGPIWEKTRVVFQSGIMASKNGIDVTYNRKKQNITIKINWGDIVYNKKNSIVSINVKNNKSWHKSSFRKYEQSWLETTGLQNCQDWTDDEWLLWEMTII